MSNVVGCRQWLLVEANQVADMKQQMMIKMVMMLSFDITSVVTLICSI
jgi:hypothetical protein